MTRVQSIRGAARTQGQDRSCSRVGGAGRTGISRTLPNRSSSLQRLIQSLAESDGEPLGICYESGHCGYGVYREIAATGHDCEVVASSLVPRKPRYRPPIGRSPRQPGSVPLHRADAGLRHSPGETPRREEVAPPPVAGHGRASDFDSDVCARQASDSWPGQHSPRGDRQGSLTETLAGFLLRRAACRAASPIPDPENHRNVARRRHLAARPSTTSKGRPVRVRRRIGKGRETARSRIARRY